jgi:hypothetical protein
VAPPAVRANCYATTALNFDALTNYVLSNVQIRYASNAIVCGPTLPSLTLRNAQICHVTNAVVSGSKAVSRLRNVLFEAGQTAFIGTQATNHVENATFHGWPTLYSGTFPVAPRLTNCLLISVTNSAVWNGSNVETTSSSGSSDGGGPITRPL